MPSSTLRRASSETGRLTALWIGVFAGPLGWAALLETNYVLSYVACEQRQTWMLHLATLVAVVIVCAAAYAARRAMPASGDESEPSTDFETTTHAVLRFMGVSAIASSAWFLVAILAMDLPVLIHGPCR